MNKATLWTIGIIVVIIAGFAWYVFTLSSAPAPTNGNNTTQSQQDDGEAAVRSVVLAFGQQLQDVSLLADDVDEQVADAYRPYITAPLLSEWQDNPMVAPGRRTSSPWPDRIEILSVAATETGAYTVTGRVVETTSSGDADSYPVVMRLEGSGSAWRIAEFEGYPPEGQ